MIDPLPLAIDTLSINEGTAQLIVGLLGIVAWSGIRLRSPAVIVAGMLTAVVLVLTFITTLPLIWFWLMVLLDVFVIALASVAHYLIQ